MARQYFWVAEDTAKFSETVDAAPLGETATLTVYNPEKTSVAQVTSVGAPKGIATAQVEVPQRFRGKAWSITLTKGSIGMLDDAWLSCGEELSPYLCPAAGQMLIPK